NTSNQEAGSQDLKLNGLYAFKVGMSTIYENGEAVPVTALRYEPMVVSQVKTKEKDGYTALQVAFSPKRAGRTTAAEKNHLKGTGFENGAYFVREVRQDLPEGAEKGRKVSIESLAKGDLVKVTSTSKGRGFA